MSQEIQIISKNIQTKIPSQPQYYQNVQTKNYIPQPQPQITQKQIKDPKQIVAQDKPLIESQFMPEFQLPNSVIKQSQIPIEQNQMKNYQMQQQQTTNYQNQQKNQNYMIPRRNPNANVKKYEVTNSNHFVNTNDPSYKSIYGMNNNTNNNVNYINQTQNQSENKGMSLNRNIYGEQNQNNINDPNLKKMKKK